MTQWLRVVGSLDEAPSLVSNTHIRWIASASVTLVPKEQVSETSSGLCVYKTHSNTCEYM